MESTLQAAAGLDDQSKKDLMSWMESESSRSKFQLTIHNFTDMCFKRCVDNADSPVLSSTEQQCLKGCLVRFINTNTKVVQDLYKNSLKKIRGNMIGR